MCYGATFRSEKHITVINFGILYFDNKSKGSLLRGSGESVTEGKAT